MPSPHDRHLTHRRSRRLAGHDYASAGWTFVTVCTRDRRLAFGEVRGGAVALSRAGRVAYACWAAIPDHAPRVRLDAFVVMPNHVHGLVGLGPPAAPPSEGGTGPVPPLRGGGAPDATMARLSPAAGSLPVVVRSYKAAVTRAVRSFDPGFAWQPRFHDHVVRDEADLRRIRAYIEGNPATWDRDRLRHPG